MAVRLARHVTGMGEDESIPGVWWDDNIKTNLRGKGWGGKGIRFQGSSGDHYASLQW
jgi:hypothetical protein